MMRHLVNLTAPLGYYLPDRRVQVPLILADDFNGANGIQALGWSTLEREGGSLYAVIDWSPRGDAWLVRKSQERPEILAAVLVHQDGVVQRVLLLYVMP